MSHFLHDAGWFFAGGLLTAVILAWWMVRPRSPKVEGI